MITNNKNYTNYSLRCRYVEPKKKIHNNQSYKQKSNIEQPKTILNNWIDHYKFTHFFTLRLQKHNEREDLRLSEQQLEKYMTLFERKLIGRRWNNKHLFFIAFAERGTGIYWHFHILFRLDGFDEERMIKALETVEIKMKLSWYNICIDTIDHLPQTVTKYSTKEVRFNQNNIGDTSTIIPSTYLFDLPYEKTYPYQFNKTNTKTSSKCVDIVKNNQTTIQQIEVTEEITPDIQTSVIQKIYNTAKSIFTAPINYVGKAVNRCLLHCFYSLPVDDYYLYHIHRQLYDDLDEGYG